ncbi:carbohydrate ABC transporter permease [Burkholderia cepacia]|uniref:carbohydrate ABC transporter permease n=1 Tax=Burkholderia cepacia TaxID=292 RepID=UPI002AB7B75F|nr:carbohydrate ABC transporter permease [Burkholderia cepacia]
MTRSQTRYSTGIIRHLLLLPTTIFALAPFVWMLSLSFKSRAEMFASSIDLVPEWSAVLHNYGAAFTDVPMLRFIGNGIFVCAAILVLQIALAAPCAYALAKHRFMGKSVLFLLVVVALMIPPQILAIPLFVALYSTGLLDTYAALILPSAISPFAIFLLTQTFRTIPDELVHAARLDGLSELSIVWRIMMPAAAPSIVAFAILSVVSHWNDLFWPLIAIQDQKLATPPLGVVFFRNQESGDDYGPLMASAVIIVTPLIIAFLSAQKRFVRGLTHAH